MVTTDLRGVIIVAWMPNQVNPKDICIEADLEELSVLIAYVVETTYLDASGAAVDSEKVSAGASRETFDILRYSCFMTAVL